MQAGSSVIGPRSDKNSALGASLESQHPVVNQHGSRREGECSDGSFSRKMNSCRRLNGFEMFHITLFGPARVYGADEGMFTGPQERNGGLG